MLDKSNTVVKGWLAGIDKTRNVGKICILIIKQVSNMKKYGPEAEKERFIQEYQEALDTSVQLTTGEVKDLVVEVMAGTFDEVQPAEIMQPIVGFIKKTLKNPDIPINWLTGDILETAFKYNLLEKLVECMPDEEDLDRLFFLNKIDWTIENRERLSLDKKNNQKMVKDLIMSFYIGLLPAKYLEGGVPTIDKVSYINVELVEIQGRVACTITVKYVNEDELAGERDVTRLLEAAGYIV